MAPTPVSDTAPPLSVQQWAECHLSIVCDTSALDRASDCLLEGLLDAPLHVLNGTFQIPDHLCTIHADGGAAGAGELLVRLEPSDAFVIFSAAFRAGNRDSRGFIHVDTPDGLDNLRMTEAGRVSIAPGGGLGA